MASLASSSRMMLHDAATTYYGEIIAKSLQKSYRGRCGRQAAELERWMIYQRSAFIIQRAYREHIEWKEIITYTNLRRVQKSMNFERVSVTKKRGKGEQFSDDRKGDESPSRELNIDGEKKHRIPQSVGQPTSLNFKKCLRNRADFDEKMSVWRAIVELRRGHFHMGTHICLKAMLEANGDVARAMILMGDPTYHLKNEGDVPLHLQQMFVPFLRDSDYLLLSKMNSSPKKKFSGSMLSTLQSMRHSADGSLIPGGASEDGGGLDLSAIVLGAYFTKYYQGRREDSIPPCQRPQSVSEIPSVKPFPAKPKPSRKTRGELLGDSRALLADATEALKSKGSRAGLSLRSRSPIRRMKKSRRPTSAGVRASKDGLLHARMASAASVNAMRALRAAESAKASAEAALGVTGRFGDYTNVYSTKRRMHGQEMRSTGRYDSYEDSIGGLHPVDDEERENNDAELLRTLLSIQNKMEEISSQSNSARAQ